MGRPEEGEKKYRTEIVARDLVMLSGNGNGDAKRDGSEETTTRSGFGRRASEDSNFDQSSTITDEDIPF